MIGQSKVNQDIACRPAYRSAAPHEKADEALIYFVQMMCQKINKKILAKGAKLTEFVDGRKKEPYY